MSRSRSRKQEPTPTASILSLSGDDLDVILSKLTLADINAVRCNKALAQLVQVKKVPLPNFEPEWRGETAYIRRVRMQGFGTRGVVPYSIYTMNVNRRQIEFRVKSEDTVGSLKRRIVAAGVFPAWPKLLFAGRVLDDDKSFCNYSIAKENRIHMILPHAGGIQLRPNRYPMSGTYTYRSTR